MTTVDEYLEQLAGRLRARLDERLVGAWVVGSGALGDLDPERSDVDVQAVSAVRPLLAERERIAAELSHEALPCPARGLEFVLYAHEDLHAPEGPAFCLNLDTGARIDRHVAYDAVQDPRFWFVIDVAIARQSGRTLAGPPAATVFPSLPRGLVLDALEEALAWFEREGADPAQTVLAACRSLAWAGDGRWRSKAQAAAWARERLPDPGVVERALALRDAKPAAPLTAREVAPVLDAARAALRDR